MGDVYTVVWAVVRWPLLLAIVVTFLVCLYRFSPNVRHSWRECVPGAIVGALLWICAAVAFRLSASLGLGGTSGVAADDPSVQIIGQSVNAVVATVLWAYLASIAILVGGEFNATLRERRDSALERCVAEARPVTLPATRRRPRASAREPLPRDARRERAVGADLDRHRIAQLAEEAALGAVHAPGEEDQAPSCSSSRPA